MTVKVPSITLMLAAASAATMLSLSPALASAPKVVAPPADVAAVANLIRTAISTTEAAFTPGESERDKQAALQAAIGAAVSGSGYDAVTAEAALKEFSGPLGSRSATAQATQAVLTTVITAARQEIAQATSTGGGATTSSGTFGGFIGGSASATGGGGGYMVGH